VHIASDHNLDGFRLPVQWVNRPQQPADPRLHDFRGLSGQIAGGVVRVGQPVWVLPAGLRSTVCGIWTYDGWLEEAFCPQSVTLLLADDVDASRGDMVVGADSLPGCCSEATARLCWLHPRPLAAGQRFLLKHTTATVQTRITSLENRIDIRTFDPAEQPDALGLNDIGEVRLQTSRPLVFDGFARNRLTGAFILIDPATHATVAAGMLAAPIQPVSLQDGSYAI